MNQKRKIEDEINFKELIKTPIRLFGWVYPYFIIVLLILGIFYVKNLTQISFNEQPVILPDSSGVIKEIPFKKGGVMPAVDLNLIENPTSDLISQGKKLFETTCASCHGTEGKGDGPAGAALNPKPRNFHSADGWVNGRKFNDMYKTLQEGIPNSGMVAYEYLSPKDRIAIIQYIRTLADFPKITKEEVVDLDNTYKLSKGIVEPNNIPVEVAIEKISNENKDLLLKAEQAIKEMSDSPQNEGALLVNKFALDKKRVFVSFLKADLGKNFQQFVTTVSSEPNDLGFSPLIVQLDSEKLRKLFEFLVKITS
ncbi:cytochrome c [Melioribacteraceae bacterium 4301-Me]|uniref:cytochrome c n=1 Tax=Pyranulibacter aquaticus TaxID=3163344 RepID=UPI003599E082